jgi:hypothetical protein
MELDINPEWTILVTYRPALRRAAASPANGSSLIAGTMQGPATFFDAWWARDFFTMSARSPSARSPQPARSPLAG